MKAKPSIPRICGAAAICIVLLNGCVVGPRYVAPDVPTPAAFKEAAPAAYATAPAGTWRPAIPQDAEVKGKWWEMFNEPELNALEQQLNINNQNIAQFFQDFMAARAQVGEARSAYFPTASVGPSYTRSGGGSTRAAAVPAATAGSAGTSFAGNAGSTTNIGGGNFTDLTLPFDVSWEPDLWGRIRNTVHESQYAAQVSAADLENERLTEQASLAAFYFELRGQDTLQELANRTVVADQQILDLTRSLAETGIDSEEDVAAAEATLASAQATAAGIAENRALFEHAIATLIGQPASTLSLPVKTLTTPVPPIPVGIPSQLLQRRPDVAAAERTMAQANALIGVDTAAYYPTLDLAANGGWVSSMLSTLFTAPARFWSLGASASETIFDGGLRKATVAHDTATFNADVAIYKQTVLTAFQQVEDSVASLRVLSQQIERQHAAVDAAQRFLDLATARYQTGIDPYLNVMTAQVTLFGDQQAETTLRVSQMTAAVQLIEALGGGWDVRQLPIASTIATQSVAPGR